MPRRHRSRPRCRRASPSTPGHRRQQPPHPSRVSGCRTSRTAPALTRPTPSPPHGGLIAGASCCCRCWSWHWWVVPARCCSATGCSATTSLRTPASGTHAWPISSSSYRPHASCNGCTLCTSTSSPKPSSWPCSTNRRATRPPTPRRASTRSCTTPSDWLSGTTPPMAMQRWRPSPPWASTHPPTTGCTCAATSSRRQCAWCWLTSSRTRCRRSTSTWPATAPTISSCEQWSRPTRCEWKTRFAPRCRRPTEWRPTMATASPRRQRPGSPMCPGPCSSNATRPTCSGRCWSATCSPRQATPASTS